MAIDAGRLRRIAIVTLALAAIGAIVGAGIGGILIGGLLAMKSSAPSTRFLLLAAQFGAAAGSVLAPVAAWTLMRRVPIWRAIGETAIGTTVGATLGILMQPGIRSFIVSPIALGVAGFALAALRLRVFYRAPGDKRPSRTA